MISNREARAAKRAAQAEKRRQEVEKRRREREDQLKREKEEFERQQQLKAELEEERKRQEEQRRLVLILCSETSYPIGYILIYKLFIPGIFQFSYCMCIVELFRIIRSNIWGDCLFLKICGDVIFRIYLNVYWIRTVFMICWGCKLIDKVYPQNYRNIDIPRMLI